MGSEAPEDVFFGPEFTDVKSIRVKILEFVELAGGNELSLKQ